MADLGNCSVLVPVYMFGGATIPNAGQPLSVTVNTYAWKANGFNTRASLIGCIITVPAGNQLVLLMQQGAVIRAAKGANGVAKFYDMDDGDYTALAADGSSWLVRIQSRQVQVRQLAQGFSDSLLRVGGKPLALVGSKVKAIQPTPTLRSNAALYWRVNVTASLSTDQFMAQIAELEFRATPGVHTLATGGTPQNSTTFGSPNTPDMAFDGVLSTSWACASGVALPQWLGYKFTSPRVVAEVRIVAGDTAARAARAPTGFTIDRSTDGTTWETVASYAKLPAWGVSESRLFYVP